MPDSSPTAVLRQAYGTLGGPTGVFSPKVADYVASRPNYPSALFDFIRDHGALGPAAVVADVGAGTGLLTVDLLRFAGRVIAIEPNADMRAACDAALGANPGYASLPGSAEATGLPDRSVDLITGAQCFHWWDASAAQREARRVLKPGGRVLLVWNDRLAADPLHEALEDLMNAHGGVQRQALLAQEAALDPDAFFSGPVLHFELPHSHRLTLEGLQALVLSRSAMPLRGAPEAAPLLQALQALFERHADATWAGAEPTLDVRYTTSAWLGAVA